MTDAPGGVQVVRTPEDLRAVRQGRGPVGFVPTMGYLHEGHAALIRRARQENALAVVSIFEIGRAHV